jgi:hypothetical protein
MNKELGFPKSWLETDQYCYELHRQYKSSGNWEIRIYFAFNKHQLIGSFPTEEEASKQLCLLTMELYWARQNYRRGVR